MRKFPLRLIAVNLDSCFLLAIALLFLFWLTRVWAAEPPLENGIAEIQKKFSSQPYTIVTDFPYCTEVIDRKEKENLAVLRHVLAGNPDALSRFEEMSHRYPSDEIAKTTQPAEWSRPKAVKAKESQAASASEGFFLGDTLIVHLNRVNQGSIQTESVKISGVAKGDFVLSTTSQLIKDPNYHKVCWAEVSEIPTSAVPEGKDLAVLHYQGKPGEKTKKLFFFPDLCVYCREPNAAEWGVKNCQNMDLGWELYPVKDQGTCRFATTDTAKAEPSAKLFSLRVPSTGVYYIGPLGSEILIHN